MDEEIDKIINRFDSLEEKLNKFIESFNIPNKQTLDSTSKLDLRDIEQMYKQNNFETFYKSCREYADSKDDSKWSESVLDGKSLFSRLFLCLAYFDIDKIARQIVSINSDEVNKSNYLQSVGVDCTKSFEQWRNCLLDCLKDVVSNLTKFGEADINHNFKHYQVGRVHLVSTFIVWEEDISNRLDLYWTDDHWSVDSWED